MAQLFFLFSEAPQALKEQRAEYLWKQLERAIPDIRRRSKAQPPGEWLANGL